MPKTGVYPVYDNVFKINTAGRSAEAATMVQIAELETFSLKIDGKVEEWTPMEQAGWMRRFMTGKSLTISLSGKRCPGDAGNDYVAGKAWLTGSDCESTFEWDFPNGDKITFPCVINVTNAGGGDSTNMAGLEADIMSDGKPTYTPATA